MNILIVEVIGHAAAVLTFVALAMYGYQFRNNLRRNVHSSRYLYRLIMATGIVFAIIHLARLYTLTAGASTLSILSWLDVAAEYPSVIAQSCIILYLLANKIIIVRTGQPRRVLVIAAHALDFELGAGATLAKMHDAGYQLFGLVLSGDSSANDFSDSAACAQFLGVNRIERGSFTSGALKDDVEGLSAAIHATIQSIQPEIILSPSCHDLNPDRQAVYAATLRAGENQNAILCYESHAAAKEFSPALYVDVADYVEIKTAALQQCRDERLQSSVHPEQVRARLAYRGLQAKVAYAEGFEVVRLLSSCLADL
jgi:LmbE family N-acetylglucosaminyl deacetylase